MFDPYTDITEKMVPKRSSSWLEEIGEKNGAGYKVQKLHEMEDSSEEEVEEVERNDENFKDDEDDESSSDNGGYKENYNELELEPEGEDEDEYIKIEAFNMKKEYRQGRFNEVGTYIKNTGDNGEDVDEDEEDDVDNIEDEILKSTDKEAIKKAYDAEQQRLKKNDEKKENDLKSAILVLFEYLKNGESVGMCLQRLYAQVKKHKKKFKGKKSGNKEVESKEGKAIENITESVVVLENSDSVVGDVLSFKKEDLENMI